MKYNIPFVALTETWLKNQITDAEININNYNVYRADREKSPHGGVLLYIHDKIAINNYLTYDDNISHGVICLSKTHKCVIICIYHPPTTELESFSNLLTFSLTPTMNLVLLCLEISIFQSLIGSYLIVILYLFLNHCISS